MFGIFFFVVREGAGMLFGELSSIGQFLFSTEWYPTSHSNVRYGVAGADRGHGQRDRAGHGDRGAVRAGRGGLRLRVLRQARRSETLKIVIELLAAIPSVVWGFIGISVMNPLIQSVFHVPIGPERAQRRACCWR